MDRPRGSETREMCWTGFMTSGVEMAFPNRPGSPRRVSQRAVSRTTSPWLRSGGSSRIRVCVNSPMNRQVPAVIGSVASLLGRGCWSELAGWINSYISIPIAAFGHARPLVCESLTLMSITPAPVLATTTSTRSPMERFAGDVSSPSSDRLQSLTPHRCADRPESAAPSDG